MLLLQLITKVWLCGISCCTLPGTLRGNLLKSKSNVFLTQMNYSLKKEWEYCSKNMKCIWPSISSWPGKIHTFYCFNLTPWKKYKQTSEIIRLWKERQHLDSQRCLHSPCIHTGGEARWRDYVYASLVSLGSSTCLHVSCIRLFLRQSFSYVHLCVFGVMCTFFCMYLQVMMNKWHWENVVCVCVSVWCAKIKECVIFSF